MGQNHKSADPVDFLAEGLDRVQSAGIAGYVVVKSQGDDVAQGRVSGEGLLAGEGVEFRTGPAHMLGHQNSV